MLKVLIIQTGDATPKAQVYGNFDDWFRNSMPGISSLTVHVHKNEKLPIIKQTLNDFSHIIISGSASMITEQRDWMLRTQHWLSQCIERIPILGVCFGHQLLTDMLGGKVDYNPLGRNMGKDLCTLTSEGIIDPLFENINKIKFSTWVSHLQSVIQLPENSVSLASCEKDNNHVVRFRKNVYGVQFHPEWNRQIMNAYIQDRQSVLRKEGLNLCEIPQDEPKNENYILTQFLTLRP